eukprot:1157166-Pelagomonas_calceolata.AAC.3
MPPPTVALAAQNNVKADADDAKAMIKAGKEQHRAAQLSSSSQHARSHRPASHGQPERSPAANASHAPSLVFKPNPSAHSLPKKKTGFKGECSWTAPHFSLVVAINICSWSIPCEELIHYRGFFNWSPTN